MSEQESEVQVPAARDRRNLYVAIGVLGGAAALVILALLIVLFVDPFGWDLLGRGRVDVAIEAMHADTALYLRFNLAKLQDEKLDALVWAFSDELEEQGKSVFASQVEDLDETLQEELGITFTEDIQPWIGASVGFGVYGLEMGPYGDLESADFVLAVETRDKDATDLFLEDLQAGLAQQSGERVTQQTVGDVLVYIVDAEEETDRLAFCRSDNLMLLSLGLEGIELALEAQSGESLAEKVEYRDAIGALPGSYLMTFYIDAAQYLDLMTGMFESLYGPGMMDLYAGTMEGNLAMAGGMSIEDIGVRFDFASVADPELVSDAVGQMVGAEPRTASLAPEDTLVYIVGPGFSGNMDQVKEIMAGPSGVEDFEEAIMFFEMSFGFNPFDDFLAKLDGEFALLLTPGSEGILAEQLDIPLAFAFIAETSDPDALLDVADSFGRALEMQGLGEAELAEYDHVTLYNLVDMFSGDSIVSFGVGQGHFLLGTSPDMMDQLFSGGASLSDSRRYTNVWREYPRGMVPVVYMDIEGLVAQIREGMSASERDAFDQETGKILRPLKFFTAAGTMMKDGVGKSTLILFIETEP